MPPLAWHVRAFSGALRGQERSAIPLSFTLLGEGPGKPLVILHGLFGSKRNWKPLSKVFRRALVDRPIYALDLRNHGASPRARLHTYETMAEDVRNFIHEEGLKDVSLLGHSMGGKVAMTLALNLAEAGKGDTLSDLVVVDMAPINLPITARMTEYITAMENINSMPRGMVKTLADAERVLIPFEPDPVVRQFLLTNLALPSLSQGVNAQHDKAKFMLPLRTLRESITNLEDFPYDYRSTYRPRWEGPLCLVAGRQSEYAVTDHLHAFDSFFPNTKYAVLDTGHWVQAERPNEFMKIRLLEIAMNWLKCRQTL